MRGLLRGLNTTLAAGLLAILLFAPADAQQARNVTEFCGVWRGVCNRTCPTGAGNCTGECATRHAACRTSGCFHFNRPGPRCFNNAADRALTDANLAPNPDRERARRATGK
jgi:hypothetical protein